jgi:hypothetical protein
MCGYSIGLRAPKGKDHPDVTMRYEVLTRAKNIEEAVESATSSIRRFLHASGLLSPTITFVDCTRGDFKPKTIRYTVDQNDNKKTDATPAGSDHKQKTKTKMAQEIRSNQEWLDLNRRLVAENEKRVAAIQALMETEKQQKNKLQAKLDNIKAQLGVALAKLHQDVVDAAR